MLNAKERVPIYHGVENQTTKELFLPELFNSHVLADSVINSKSFLRIDLDI